MSLKRCVPELNERADSTQVESTTSSSSAATTGKRGISYNNAAFTDAFGSK